MASEEFIAFQKAMAERPAPPPPANLQELRARIDANMKDLPLAEGTEAVEVDADGVPCIEVRVTDAGADAPVMVWYHGGGFRMASALAYRSYGSHLAKAIRGRVLLVDYRLAPENPFPAAADDAETAYRWVLAQGTDAGKVVLAGDSAGGGLTASVALRALAAGPAPAALICCSPLVDLTISGATYDTNADVDKLWSRSSAEEVVNLYLGDHDPSDPQASPVFGAWAGTPPLLIQVGSIETLLDDSNKLAEVVRAAGGDVTVHVYDDMPHVWQMSYPAYPEAVEAVEEIGAFVRRHTA